VGAINLLEHDAETAAPVSEPCHDAIALSVLIVAIGIRREQILRLVRGNGTIVATGGESTGDVGGIGSITRIYGLADIDSVNGCSGLLAVDTIVTLAAANFLRNRSARSTRPQHITRSVTTTSLLYQRQCIPRYFLG
jgi:hypothetical protein